jgi:hypothetical protein
MRWFDMRFRNEALQRDKASVKWIQEASEAVHYELQDSNFDQEINRTYQGLTGAGTSILTLEEGDSVGGWGGLVFKSIPLKESYFQQAFDGHGLVRFWREVEWTPTEILSKFGRDVPERILTLEKAGSTEKLSVLYCIYPRSNKVMKWGEKVAPSRRPWSYVYLLKDSAERLGFEGGYYEMPAYAGRWACTNSSDWGNSPSMFALGDVLTLNQVVKDDLRAKAKQVDPPMLAEERSIINDLNLDPNTLSVVRSIKGIAPLLSGGSLQASDITIARLQSAIRNYYMTDRIDFPDMQAQPMTATEANIRYERMQRYMGATLAMIRNDILNPTVERAFNMLVRAERIPQPPDIVHELGGSYDILYLGSLTRAQQVDEVAAIERTVMSAAGMAEVFPDALDVVDAEEAVRLTAGKLNAPATMIRDAKEVKRIRAKRQADQERMQEAQIAEQEANTLDAQLTAEGNMSGQQAPPPA